MPEIGLNRSFCPNCRGTVAWVTRYCAECDADTMEQVMIEVADMSTDTIREVNWQARQKWDGKRRMPEENVGLAKWFKEKGTTKCACCGGGKPPDREGDCETCVYSRAHYPEPWRRYGQDVDE